MTTTTGARPRIRMCIEPSAQSLGAGLDAALTMLVEARRIALVGEGEPAEIVHTVGPVSGATRYGVHHVHSVDRIPLRNGRLEPAGWWVRNERSCISGATALLAHGQTAGRLLVDAGLLPGQRVHCLPLVGPPGTSTTIPGTRALVRAHLGVAPGVRLVLGVDSHAAGNRAGGWDRLLLATKRGDLSVAQIWPSPDADLYHVRMGAGSWQDAPLPLGELIAAADLYVAAGHELQAYTPAVVAVACALPVIAVTTDSVVELVLAGSDGCVVPVRAGSVVQAVLARVDGGLPLRRPAMNAPDRLHRVAELARGLLRVYRQVLCTSTVQGAA